MDVNCSIKFDNSIHGYTGAMGILTATMLRPFSPHFTSHMTNGKKKISP